MATEYAGELVIEWPETDGEFRHAVAGTMTAPYEFRMGYGLTLLEDVTALTVRVSVKDVITAEVTRLRLTGDPDEPFTEEVSTWLVVGFRTRARVS
jgi:hypothetical protein